MPRGFGGLFVVRFQQSATIRAKIRLRLHRPRDMRDKLPSFVIFSVGVSLARVRQIAILCANLVRLICSDPRKKPDCTYQARRDDFRRAAAVASA